MDVVNSSHIYNMRFMSIFSVICAHTATIVGTSTNIIMAGNILHSLGSIGVIVFYFLSGYLFNESSSIRELLKRKTVSIIVPWFFTGVCVYLYVALRKGFHFIDFIKYILGLNSYLYFLFVLFVLYILYCLIKNKRIRLMLSMLSLASIVLTSIDLLSFVNPYINVFNWYLYFQIGVFARKHCTLDVMTNGLHKYRILASCIFLIVLLVSSYKNIVFSYTSMLFLPFVSLGTMCIISFADTKIIGKFRYIGEISFSIYLLHMPVAGMITKTFSYFETAISIISRPLVVLSITSIFIFVYQFVFRRIKYKSFMYTIIGLR